MALVTKSLLAALQQVEAAGEYFDRVVDGPAGGMEVADAVGRLETAWAQMRHAAVEACRAGQTPSTSKRGQPRLTATRAAPRLSR